MSRIDDIAAEIHAEISEKRKAERKEAREHAISMAKMRAHVREHKAKEAEAARQARNQRLIQEALDEAAQLASKATESDPDAEPEATVEEAAEDVLEAPRAKLKGLTARYPLFGEKGVELREAADILNVSESDVQGLLDSGELEPFVIVSKTRKMDENGIILPREQKVYPHLVSIESLRAHIDA